MAVPTSREQAQGRKGSMYNDKEFNPSEKSRYLALKYDYEHNSLPAWKEEEYFNLRDKYETS